MYPQSKQPSLDGIGTSLPFGIAADTLVATLQGWRALGGLRLGDLLHTVNAGPSPLLSLRHADQTSVPAVRLPAAAFGNRTAQSLLPGQTVLLQSDTGDDMFGAADTLLPALALLGWHGAHPCAATGPFVIPGFAFAALIYAGPGLILCCPGPRRPLAGLLSEPGITSLSLHQGLDLVNCLIAEDVGAALGGRLQAAC